MKLLCQSVFALFGLTACASTDSVSVTREASTSSVLISYDTTNLQNPSISDQHASRIAGSQCSLLGYGATEPAVHVTQQCSSVDSSGSCILWQVQKSYSCTGNFISMDANTLRPVSDNGTMRSGQ